MLQPNTFSGSQVVTAILLKFFGCAATSSSMPEAVGKRYGVTEDLSARNRFIQHFPPADLWTACDLAHFPTSGERCTLHALPREALYAPISPGASGFVTRQKEAGFTGPGFLDPRTVLLPCGRSQIHVVILEVVGVHKDRNGA